MSAHGRLVVVTGLYSGILDGLLPFSKNQLGGGCCSTTMNRPVVRPIRSSPVSNCNGAR
jgi:hypothetical protein